MTEEKTDQSWIVLQEDPLDLAAADAFLRTEEAGGLCLFTGTTRRAGDEGRATARLEFEAYEGMAVREMQRVGEEARQRWPSVARIVLLHRTGAVPLTEASVVCGASAPHRAEAFAACRFLINTLKAQVPLWKKEVYADGQSAWKKGAAAPSSNQRPAEQAE